MKPKEMKVTPFAKNAPDEEYVRKTHVFGGVRDEDPREALLKYAEKAEKEPMFTSVYKSTQPKTIYSDVVGRPEEEAAEEDARKKFFKKRKTGA